MRSGYQDLAARGLLTYEELGVKLAALEETRILAHRELESLKDRRERLESLKQDREAVLQAYANVTVESLERLSPEERNRLYKTLKLRVVIHDDGTPEVSGVFATDDHGDDHGLDGAESSEKRTAMAIALYEKFGFEVEGTHSRLAFRDGEYTDAYSMARLKP